MGAPSSKTKRSPLAVRKPCLPVGASTKREASRMVGSQESRAGWKGQRSSTWYAAAETSRSAAPKRLGFMFHFLTDGADKCHRPSVYNREYWRDSLGT